MLFRSVFAEVGQLVDVLDATRGLEHQGLEAGRDGGGELGAQRLGAQHDLVRIGDIGRGDAVEHIRRRVAQHALGADVEDLDHTALVGGDAGEVGAVEDGGLQRASLQQVALAPRLGSTHGFNRRAARGRHRTCIGHGRLPWGKVEVKRACTRRFGLLPNARQGSPVPRCVNHRCWRRGASVRCPA